MKDDSELGELQDELMALFRKARGYARGGAHKVHPDLAQSAYPMLVFVVRNPGARAQDIAHAFNLDKGVVSRHLCHLEELGLVERAEDPRDKRAHTLKATNKAFEGILAVKAEVRERLALGLQEWKEGEVRELTRLLSKFNQDFDV